MYALSHFLSVMCFFVSKGNLLFHESRQKHALPNNSYSPTNTEMMFL